MASTSERLVSEALHRVVIRHMRAGRNLSYDQLLAETAAEVDVLLEERRERDARLSRKARKRVLRDQLRVAAVAESRAAADAERQLADSAAALGPPAWHPEHAEHPENL